MSTKIHALVDGHELPLTIILTAGQRGDCPVLIPLLERLRVPRTVGRPRTQPDELRADKAYSSRAVRRYLREHRITATIPEKKNVIAARRRKARRVGGRPPSTPSPTRAVTWWNGSSATSNSGEAWPPGSTNSHSSTGRA
ncbi:transposase [Corynebacterium camporealensis]|uniref:transposase n=1 Tax=Corynebacterium camporealensis TaxID=161896 RepID=UPI0009DF016D|nr:transposase [Corynebacterium camporealensis]